MARKVRDYTEVGKRITALCGRQRVVARLLKVSQQTVSKKLRGETAILLPDLERLGAHYGIPLTYFFEEGAVAPDLAKAIEKVKKAPGALQDLIVLLSAMSDSSVAQVLALTKVIAQGKKEASRRGAAAEGAPSYGNDK